MINRRNFVLLGVTGVFAPLIGLSTYNQRDHSVMTWNAIADAHFGHAIRLMTRDNSVTETAIDQCLNILQSKIDSAEHRVVVDGIETSNPLSLIENLNKVTAVEYEYFLFESFNGWMLTKTQIALISLAFR
jgi:hypothetical protein